MTHYICKHCKRKLRTEALMISHLRFKHGMDIPQGIEVLFDGGLERIKEDFKRMFGEPERE